MYENELLDEIKTAMRGGEVRLHITPTFMPGGDAVRVEGKVKGRWKKVGCLIFPPEGGSITDVLTMLADFRAGDTEAVAS